MRRDLKLGGTLAALLFAMGLVACEGENDLGASPDVIHMDARGGDTSRPDVAGDAGGAPLDDIAAGDTAAGMDTPAPLDGLVGPDVAETSDVAEDAAREDVAAPAPPVPPSSLTYDVPEMWSEPIADYLQVGFEHTGGWDFLMGIHDLQVFDGRLYLGYGDANVNLGRQTAIEFRSFASPDDPAVVAEFATDDEQLERYRRIGDRLFLAGVDATEDAFLGNVYFRAADGEAGEEWVKSRTLSGGVHVHDVVGFAGDLWACGSGAQPEEWTNGDIYGHVWRSIDGGESFEVFFRRHNDGVGDARYTRLLPVGDKLYLFGYNSDAQFQIHELPNGVYDGESVTIFEAGHPLSAIFPSETDILPDGTGLIRGVDASQEELRSRVWRLHRDGSLEALEVFFGKTVLDVSIDESSGEVVFLAVDGDDYLVPDRFAPWPVTVYVSSDMATFEELLSFEWDNWPQSIAYWEGALYFGSHWGHLWRSVGQRAEAPTGR